MHKKSHHIPLLVNRAAPKILFVCLFVCFLFVVFVFCFEWIIIEKKVKENVISIYFNIDDKTSSDKVNKLRTKK